MTIDELRKDLNNSFFPSLDKLVHYVHEFKKNNPKKLVKPILKYKHTLEDAENYVLKLKEYNEQKDSYQQNKKDVQKFNQELDNLISEWMKKDVGLEKLTLSQQKKVWDMAWEKGHSSGYNQVYYYLQELFELFE